MDRAQRTNNLEGVLPVHFCQGAFGGGGVAGVVVAAAVADVAPALLLRAPPVADVAEAAGAAAAAGSCAVRQHNEPVYKCDRTFGFTGLRGRKCF